MKALYDTVAQKVKPYPRNDDENVVGLDPIYVSLEVTQEPQPTLQAGESLNATETVNLSQRTVTYGWEVVPAPAPPPIRVSMLAMRLALARLDLFASVTAAINAISDPAVKMETQIWWTNSLVVESGNPIVDSIAAAIGKTPDEVADVFALAQQIESET